MTICEMKIKTPDTKVRHSNMGNENKNKDKNRHRGHR